MTASFRPHFNLGALLTLTATLFVVACASQPTIAVPELPAQLRAPANQVVYVEALATGVQIYECAPKSGQPVAYEWTFKSPEATLATRSGQAIGKHYGGPTWEAIDGSTVVGDLKARDAAPDASAIPWLLLANKSNSGTGLFSQAKSVQRVQTKGGIAPITDCGAGNAKEVARVPYTATYYFYRSAN